MKDLLERLLNTLNSYKPNFVEYITNPNVHLDDRWETFLMAPYEFKEHLRSYPNLKLAGDTISWYDDFYVEKYQTVEAETLLEWVLESENEHSKEVVDSFKEEILKQNMGSFVYDW